MRLLLIDDDPRQRALIRHHVSCRWPDAEVASYGIAQRGPLPQEFRAQGYDAVLLAHDPEGSATLEFLQDLPGRNGFAPVIFLADPEAQFLMEEAHSAGVFAVLPRARVDHQQFIATVEAAAQRHQELLADWRVSPEAEESRRFGDARIPGYRRARLLARGSVSHLYVAESEKAASLVVLKVTPSLRDESGVDQSFNRFLQEYEIAQRVRHPNIVRLYEFGVADDHAYLAMEYFPQGDLRRRMRAGISPFEALGIAAQVARVLVSIHGAGILHRDLKPGNIMLRNDGQIALIDFGLAKHAALEYEITDTGLIFGTPHYMSPEQGHGQDLDVRSDLYSLGVLLYEMLTTKKPFTADNPMAIIYLHRNSPIPELPEPLQMLQPLINKLLAKEPADRYESAQVVVKEIDAARAAWLTAGGMN
jgi:tRNA A-37 threonylcarbamoyl transferase component Bud32